MPLIPGCFLQGNTQQQAGGYSSHAWSQEDEAKGKPAKETGKVQRD
jgi:hypothetical protein